MTSKASRNQQQRETSVQLTANVALADLKSAYRHWWDMLQSRGKWNWNPDEALRRQIVHGLRRFGGNHVDSEDSVNAVVLALAKGKELIESTLSWNNPVVGGRGNSTDADRGTQWRLVLAWSGLENIITTTCNNKKVYRQYIAQFVQGCDLPPFEPLLPPDRRLSHLDRWLTLHRSPGAADIHRFLGMTGEDVVQVIRSWLIDGNEVANWLDAMVLAKALRHVSAHGALSASKIQQWGLRSAFCKLIPEIGLVAATAFRNLVDDTDHHAVAGRNRSKDGKLLALNLRQPLVEALLMGVKSVETRSQPTTTLGRIYVYASDRRHALAEEAAILRECGLEDLETNELRRGVVLGTIELFDCTSHDGFYQWHFRNPERLKRPRAPRRPPRGTWFSPF